MIVNSESKRDKTALDFIENSPYKFYLGGSRRMYQLQQQDQAKAKYTNVKYSRISVTKDTDYDFYVTYSDEVQNALLGAGFAYTGNCAAEWYALDEEVVAILERDNVQVVLRKDAEFYKAVFESIPTWYFYKYLWKSSPEFMNDRSAIQPTVEAMYAVARAQQGR